MIASPILVERRAHLAHQRRVGLEPAPSTDIGAQGARSSSSTPLSCCPDAATVTGLMQLLSLRSAATAGAQPGGQRRAAAVPAVPLGAALSWLVAAGGVARESGPSEWHRRTAKGCSASAVKWQRRAGSDRVARSTAADGGPAQQGALSNRKTRARRGSSLQETGGTGRAAGGRGQARGAIAHAALATRDRAVRVATGTQRESHVCTHGADALQASGREWGRGTRRVKRRWQRRLRLARSSPEADERQREGRQR